MLVALGTAFALLPRPARAADPEGTADLAAQFYDVRSPTGETVLQRRRLTASVGVSAYDLLTTPPGDVKAPTLTLRARLRYDADYGTNGNVTDPAQVNDFVPGHQNNLVDLMYAYIEGRRFAGGLVGFKVGRQYVTDALGWWSFDGGEVSVTTPFFVKAEVYGGFEQRGGIPLSTGRYESEGIWRASRGGFDPNRNLSSLYTSFQPSEVAPAFGAALESTGSTWIHGRLTYRRVYNTGASNVSEFASGLYAPATYESWRISSDRLGYAMDVNAAKVGGLKLGVVYDLYRSEITSLYGSIDAYLGNKVTLGADVDYYVPWFDGDSIWNFFAGQPTTTGTVRANVDVNRHLSLSAGALVKFYTVQTSPFDPISGASNPKQFGYSPSLGPAGLTYFPPNEHPTDEGGNLAVRWRTGETQLGLRGAGTFGDEGSRVGADLSGEHLFEGRYIVSGRAGVWQWNDKLRADRDAVGANYVASVGYRFEQRSRATVDWEHDINRIAGQRFRVLVRLTVAVTP
ncbi:MAG: hypothetical protein JOZ69_16710 [Myxococcales bacterium]|nr:hypothetical protein [Myxococcales bacterium]